MSDNKNFVFDYGIIEFKHRFNMTRSLDDYKVTTLNKCIRMGIEYKYYTMARDNLSQKYKSFTRTKTTICVASRLTCTILHLRLNTREICKSICKPCRQATGFNLSDFQYKVMKLYPLTTKRSTGQNKSRL